MSGIAGIAAPGEKERVQRMLDALVHRGRAGRSMAENEQGTIGAVWSRAQAALLLPVGPGPGVQDAAGNTRLASAQLLPEGLLLVRDQLGVAPLYYGWTDDSRLAFASEVKALLEVAQEVHELAPGHRFQHKQAERYWLLTPRPLVTEPPERIALELCQRLEASVSSCIGTGELGAWLSGGLDSSAMAALAKPHVSRLFTFAAGVSGAPDLEFAREVAAFINSDHHEVVVTQKSMIAALPEVIWHLESFDALLVRSSVTNYLVARRASDYVPAVLSGEGGDELFAGYHYLKSLPLADLPAELRDITGRLHNTALQRVDRSASAHGMVAHVPFLDPAVVDYALSIPAEHKIRDGVEKWILRRALAGTLPESVLNRPKAKFWEGAGVGEQLAAHANATISDGDFRLERVLHNGWTLNTKEELLYYRIFKERFGSLLDLEWMGRTKGAPQTVA